MRRRCTVAFATAPTARWGKIAAYGHRHRGHINFVLVRVRSRSAAIASGRGRSGLGFFFLSLIFRGPLAVGVAVLAAPGEENTTQWGFFQDWADVPAWKKGS